MIRATRLPPSWAWTAGIAAARDNRPGRASRSMVVTLFHLSGWRVPHEGHLAAAVIQGRVRRRLSRYQPVTIVSVLNAGRLTGTLNIFANQLTILVLHSSLISLGLGLVAADGVQLRAAPIEFQCQVSRRTLRTA